MPRTFFAARSRAKRALKMPLYALGFIGAGCATTPSAPPVVLDDDLTGQWRQRVDDATVSPGVWDIRRDGGLTIWVARDSCYTPVRFQLRPVDGTRYLMSTADGQQMRLNGESVDASEVSLAIASNRILRVTTIGLDDSLQEYDAAELDATLLPVCKG